MSAVATSSGIATPFKRPRTSSSDDESVKKTKYYLKKTNFYILAPETTEDSSDGSESVYSIQGQTTDLAKDTSDSSSDTYESSMVELEVVSLTEDEQVYPLPMKDSSSSPEDVTRVVALDAQSLVFSDSDSSRGSSVSLQKDCRRLNIFTTCIQCGLKNPLPFFRFCIKCYKVRKNFFPPRPKRRKNREVMSLKGVKNSERTKLSGDSVISSGYSENLQSESKDLIISLGDNDDNTQTKELCGTCLIRPKDGGYIHKNIVHVYSCYKCSIKIVKSIGRCPICNLRVNQVCKVITF